jgi:hypothetical protein
MELASIWNWGSFGIRGTRRAPVQTSRPTPVALRLSAQTLHTPDFKIVNSLAKSCVCNARMLQITKNGEHHEIHLAKVESTRDRRGVIRCPLIVFFHFRRLSGQHSCTMFKQHEVDRFVNIVQQETYNAQDNHNHSRCVADYGIGGSNGDSVRASCAQGVPCAGIRERAVPQGQQLN